MYSLDRMCSVGLQANLYCRDPVSPARELESLCFSWHWCVYSLWNSRYFNWQKWPHTSDHKSTSFFWNSASMPKCVCLHAHVCVCVSVCVSASVRTCMCVCMCLFVCVLFVLISVWNWTTQLSCRQTWQTLIPGILVPKSKDHGAGRGKEACHNHTLFSISHRSPPVPPACSLCIWSILFWPTSVKFKPANCSAKRKGEKHHLFWRRAFPGLVNRGHRDVYI